jgi:hypothetical protein
VAHAPAHVAYDRRTILDYMAGLLTVTLLPT